MAFTISSLPENIKLVLGVELNTQVNIDIATKYKLTVGQLAKMSGVSLDVFCKNIPVSDLDAAIVKRVGVTAAVAKKIALEFLGRRLLVIDAEWFDGEVTKKIKQLGGDEKIYEKDVALLKVEIAKGKVELEKETKELARKKDEAKKEEEGEKEEPLAITNPEEEKQSAKIVFSSQIKDILSGSSVDVRQELNARMTILLLDDETEQFQHEILDVLQNNHELLTGEMSGKGEAGGESVSYIVSGEEKVEPTVGNWIKDYIRFAGADDVQSSIKKAQYFTESANIRQLKPQERKVVEACLDLYINLRNFYLNITREDMGEVHLFPISIDEQIAAERKERENADLTAKKADLAEEAEKEVDIAALYQDKPEDRAGIDQEKQLLIQKTRKESDRVADAMEEFMLRRKKYGTLACLEVLVETGALDDVLAKDIRFTNFLFGYFKRNEMKGEDVAFKKDPYQAKYVADFLKFVLLERLGLPSNEGARIAANLSNVFRSQGQNKYGQLAYLDLSDYSFKWN